MAKAVTGALEHLHKRVTAGGQVWREDGGPWRLEVPAGPAGQYRLAQLDDYGGERRRQLRWIPPVELRLQAKVSTAEVPGTWGFGWWNDPFSVSLGLGGSGHRLPALPNAAWFFHASPPNYLSFGAEDHPSQGFLTGTFSSPRPPAALYLLGLPVYPLVAWPPTARWLRRAARLLIREDATALTTDPATWHAYSLRWTASEVAFSVDGERVFTTNVVPRPPLGLVIWIDNQYMAFPPNGELRFGSLANPEVWLQVRDLEVVSA